jgi:hypothetical protein
MSPSEEDLKMYRQNIAKGKGGDVKGPGPGTPYYVKPKLNKYNATKVDVQTGVDENSKPIITTFDSKKEAARYLDLELYQKAGAITELELQPKFSIDINGVHICNYFADFSYLDGYGQRTVEDVKGMKTPVYKLKKKMVKAVHGIDIIEI